jgi:hypothetical protein
MTTFGPKAGASEALATATGLAGIAISTTIATVRSRMKNDLIDIINLLLAWNMNDYW